jgi:hypothetical protein
MTNKPPQMINNLLSVTNNRPKALLEGQTTLQVCPELLIRGNTLHWEIGGTSEIGGTTFPTPLR